MDNLKDGLGKDAENGEPGAWPADWMVGFLLAFRANGNIGQACQAAGTTRTKVYNARFSSAKFRDAYDEAREDAIDTLEQEAWGRAKSGSDMLLWKLLSSLRRSTYGEKVEINLTVKAKIEELAEQFELAPTDVMAEVERILQGEREQSAGIGS